MKSAIPLCILFFRQLVQRTQQRVKEMPSSCRVLMRNIRIDYLPPNEQACRIGLLGFLRFTRLEMRQAHIFAAPSRCTPDLTNIRRDYSRNDACKKILALNQIEFTASQFCRVEQN